MSLTIAPSVRHDADAFPFDPVVAEVIWRMEDRHFWHAARNAWIEAALLAHGVPPPARVLEIGCGSGAVARHLARAGYAVTGVDTCVELLEKAEARCPSSEFFAAEVGALGPEHDGRYEAVGLFDVLEHIEAPARLLVEACTRLRPGGLVLATVPAVRSLRSVFDDLAGHKRRYEVGELGALFRDAELVHVHEHGIFRASLPALRAARALRPRLRARDLTEERRRALLARDFRVPSWPLNRAMALLCRAELALGLERARGRRGASLLAVGFAGDGGHE